MFHLPNRGGAGRAPAYPSAFSEHRLHEAPVVVARATGIPLLPAHSGSIRSHCVSLGIVRSTRIAIPRTNNGHGLRNHGTKFRIAYDDLPRIYTKRHKLA